MKNSQLTVIAGSAKGKKLKVPAPKSGKSTEPASSRLKAALFSVLMPHIKEDTKFLDLYAGSGQIGIEALSRGADRATFVDISENANEIIHQNLANTGFSYKAEVLDLSSDEFLNNFPDEENKYNIIFLDPPFKTTSKEKFYDIIHLSTSFLLEGGILVIKHPSLIELELKEKQLVLADSKKYGINMLTFFVLPFEKA